MPQAVLPDDPPAELLSELAEAWLSGAQLPDAAAQAEAICRRAEADDRVQMLSAAYRALRLSLSFPCTAENGTFVAATVEQARRLGWWRAIALAEAAEAHMVSNQGLPLQQVIAHLERHGSQVEDARPPAERVWTDKALCVLRGNGGDYAAALVHGARADALAVRSGLCRPQVEACLCLAYVFFSVGDLDGAQTVLQRALALQQRFGMPTYSVGYNLLLCHVVAGRHQAAAGWLTNHPDLLAGNPGLAALDCLVARVWQDCGDSARALKVLAAMGTASDEAHPALRANRVWLEASVRLQHGQAAAARASVQAHLDEVQAQGVLVSPMNRTQLELVLSQACEALGDLPAALEALKRSRLSCYHWVADSVRTRLLALHLDTPGQDNSRHERRVREVEEALKQARQEHDQQASARQVRFLAHVTHEMRNPLHGLIGMTSLLALSKLDETQQRYLGLAQSSARMLLALCNDVLDLARVESGRFELNPQAHRPAQLMQEAVQVFLPPLQQRGVALELEVDPAVPEALRVDSLRLQQVVMNLVGNAAKFTREGCIRVSAAWHPLQDGMGELHVAVQDTGPGLTAEQRARLFQEFSQGDATVAQQHGGSGLGLALCRSLVELMGGRIGVESEPGRGSRFHFGVPLAVA